MTGASSRNLGQSALPSRHYTNRWDPKNLSHVMRVSKYARALE